MGFAASSAGDYYYPTTASHTCWSRCPACGYVGTSNTYPISPSYNDATYTLPAALIKPDARARWFDVFRRWTEPPKAVSRLAWARLVRQLKFVSTTERRARKRRAWLHRLAAL